MDIINKKLLMIEATGSSCSVAIASQEDGLISSLEEKNATGRHASILPLMINQITPQSNGYVPSDIGAIAISAGPGSYTGLRIGASLAKGLCMGWKIPLIAIPTLDIIAFQAKQKYQDKEFGKIIAMLDARRNEVYTATYSGQLTRQSKDEAVILSEDFLKQFNSSDLLLLAGNGASKCCHWKSTQIIIDDQIIPLAKDMFELANQKITTQDYVDIAYWEPNYLKEYIAIVAKNKILNK